MSLIHIRISQETRMQFKAICATLNKSMTQVIGDLITEFLSREIKGL